MNFLFVFFVFAIAITVIDGQSDPWIAYKKKFMKTYNSSIDAIRKQVFTTRSQAIIDHNSKPSANYRRELTRFSDMPSEDFKTFLGVNTAAIPFAILKHSIKPDINEPENLRQNTPYSFDYRYDSCLPDVKNQGKCASSWAFSAITPIEFAYCKKNNNISVLLSEQQLLDCDQSGKDKGCNGGWPMNAWEYVSNNNGVASGLQYPYAGGVGVCKYNNSMMTAGLKKFNYLEAQSVVDMKYAIFNFGPLSVTLAATDSLADYADGVYDDVTCDGQAVNYAAVIIGWGKLNGLEYWIVRNSWGNAWGLKGYFLIQLGVNKCGIESYPAYALVN